MTTPRYLRPGVSLMEILVAIAIAGLLLALLLPAIQKVRQAASIIREKNKVKQIELAFHMLAEQTGGMAGGALLFRSLLPYLDHPLTEEQLQRLSSDYAIPVFVNYDDPSLAVRSNADKGAASYAFNYQIHGNMRVLRAAVLRDGASNTIELTTHYTFGMNRDPDGVLHGYSRSWMIPEPLLITCSIEPDYRVTPLPTTFANPYVREILPSSPEAAVVTFQAKPPVDQIDYRIPQSPYSHGLLVGMADGSVRMVSPNVSPRTFWAAVSPNGGDLLGPDW
ncbi:MAG: DUF1559 domain-containing protein [Gemmataceae bacterium]|nr:DUF1559 domain-containing protein [Gemmataceae bacterium]MCS7272226.1 DUF1559 domain-containing protein [Gemmataceae bacterium]MDW8242761.1 prepilin-type N-terminal cleavage/methylation domain-containing protein [Thermogemmata sp.]